MKRFKIDYSFILFVLLIAFSPKQYLLWKLILALILHECGHLIMILLARYEIESLKLSIFGFSLKLKHTRPVFWKDLCVYSGGIIMNLICIFLFRDAEFRQFHFLLLILNSLPIYPLDGFNIFKTLLSYVMPYFYTLWITSFMGVLLCLASLITIIYFKLDLFLIWSFVYLLIEGCLLIYRIPKQYRLFLLQKELYDYEYPIKSIGFKEYYWRYFYHYHKVEMMFNNKKITEKELIILKNKSK